MLELGIPEVSNDLPRYSAQIGAATRVSLPLGTDFAGLSSTLLDTVLAASRPNYSLWWTVGSELVAPVGVVCQGLPSEDDFITLMTGRTQRGTDMAGSRPADGDG